MAYAQYGNVSDHTHAHTLRLGMGLSMGLQTFLINFQAAKKQRQLGMPTERRKGRREGEGRYRQSAVRVDAKVNKNVNTPNVMLTRQTERKQSELELQTQCTVTGYR